MIMEYIEKVIKSCKTREQVKIASNWAYRVVLKPANKPPFNIDVESANTIFRLTADKLWDDEFEEDKRENK